MKQHHHLDSKFVKSSKKKSSHYHCLRFFKLIDRMKDHCSQANDPEQYAYDHGLLGYRGL